MKVKKQIEVSPTELQVGDELVGIGRVVYIHDDAANEWVDVAFIDKVSNILETNGWRRKDGIDVIREVDTPDTVSVFSRGGAEFKICNIRPNDGGELLVIVDGDSYVVDPVEMIDAIKTVKGIE